MQKHKLISAIVALLIAMVLWAYAVTYVSPEDNKTIHDIPVKFKTEDVLQARGLILTSGRDQTIDLKVSGKRSDLVKLSADNIKLTADLSNITEAGTWDITYTITYPDTVANGNIVVESKSSSTVRVEVSMATVKTLKPSLNISGELAEGYLLDDSKISCDVESITITGPSYEVDAIESARVDVDVSGMDAAENVTCTYQLLDSNDKKVTLSELCEVSLTRAEGSTETSDEVIVTLPILRYKEVTLKATLENTPDGITVDDCVLTPSAIRITGESAALDKLGSTISVSVDLSKVTTAQASWELPCVISLDSGLFVYTTADDTFDGITVNAMITVSETTANATDNKQE